MKEIIKVEGLEYTYPDGTKALRGVELSIFEGESVGLIGPNGAGKSTLLLHLNGILRGKGKVEIMGLEITNKNLALIRSKVGLVFQDPEDQLFMPTVFDDVAFGPINIELTKEEVNISVEKALKEVDMIESIKRASHHLSFGEKKRVSIATVLSMSPEILVLDEPSSNLDPRHRRELIRLLNQTSITKLIATHDLDLISQTCVRVALLHKGNIVAIGNTYDIIKDKSLLDRYGL
jgi:cobalt/nickel transport system ATP-binding protein